MNQSQGSEKIDKALHNRLTNLPPGHLYIWTLKKQQRRRTITAKSDGSIAEYLLGVPKREEVTWDSDEDLSNMINEVCEMYKLDLINIESLTRYTKLRSYGDEYTEKEGTPWYHSSYNVGYKVFVRKRRE